MRKWGKRGLDQDLEARLRSHRVDASDAFVEGLSGRMPSRGFRPRQTGSRLAFAAAISVFILGTFASLGGLSYAASGAEGVYHVAKQVPTGHLQFTVHTSSAAAQYSSTKPHKKARVLHAQTHQGTAGVQATLGATKTSGTLPFTGLSLLGTAILSLVLIATGLVLRRRERQS